MHTMHTMHLHASRNETDPRDLYALRVERGEFPALYDRLRERGYQEEPASEAAPEVRVITISGSESQLRREIADALGLDPRHVEVLQPQPADDRVRYIDVTMQREVVKMERVQYIELTVGEFERALGEEATECAGMAKDDAITVWADGVVETDVYVLSDRVGEEAWSYLADDDQPYAGFQRLVARSGASIEAGYR